MRNEKRKDKLYIKIESILESNKKFDARLVLANSEAIQNQRMHK